jgi:hypothetical protein
MYVYAKNKSSLYTPEQAHTVQEVEAPKFLDNRHMKVAKLSALSTGRLNVPLPTQGASLVFINDRRRVYPRALVCGKKDQVNEKSQ